MSHFQYIQINNFKSIQDLKIEDCRRINLFIGYPNVGKSNILEALSLFSVPYLNHGDAINRLIRVENKYDLFYDPLNKSGFVETNLNRAQLQSTQKELEITIHPVVQKASFRETFIFETTKNVPFLHLSASAKTPIEKIAHIPVKKYSFPAILEKTMPFIGTTQLHPPFGENILETLAYGENLNEVKNWIKNELDKFDLEYVVDKSNETIKIQKRLTGDTVLQLPYTSIADTLQRLIFYKTAIASNNNAILLFEEPEAHAFPPYISTLTNDIINSTTNQFFITTHSPFVINDFIEDKRKDVAIYIIDYKNGQTITRRLSDAELDEVYNFGIDLFFNLEKYL